MTWRTGTKNPHTLYEHDEPVGMVITPRDGERIAAAMNGVSNEGDVLRDKLAAARALLERCERYVPNGSLNDDLKALLAAQPATAPTVYCSRCRERVSTSGPYCASCLAGQPATAPVFVYGGEGMPDVELEPTAPIEYVGSSSSPLPPAFEAANAARTEAEPSLWCDSCEEPMDREGDNPAGVCDVCWGQHQADKAVLDAMGRVPLDVLRAKAKREPFYESEPAAAELARRGLKP